MILQNDWAGQPVAVVAGGPSFSAADARLIGMARARKGLRVIAVNDAVYPCWFADLLYACDAKWWEHHSPSLEGFAGRRMRLDSPIKAAFLADVEVIGNGGETGFDRRPGFIKHGKNSAYQALHVAVHLGATNIIMVGLDMSGDHWFGEHPPEVHRPCGIRGTMIRHFNGITPHLEKRGVRVVNASAGSKVTAFDHMNLSDWLQELEER